MTPMGCGLANTDGIVTESLIAYYMVIIIGESDHISPGGGNGVIIGEIMQALSVDNAVIMTGRRFLKIGADRIVYPKLSTGEIFGFP